MDRRLWVAMGSWLFVAVLAAPGSARAQSARPSASAQPSDDDDATRQPAEPDYRLINLPTTLRLPRHRSSFELTHRFNGNLRNGTFSNDLNSLFGLDDGASIGFEYRYAVLRHVEAAVFRNNIDKTIQFYGKVDAWHQRGALPVSISGLLSVEGGNNFRRGREPALGATVGRTINSRVALYATPIWVHNSAGAAGVLRDTVLLGVGGRARVRSNTYLVAEISPRLGGYAPGKPEFAFGLEERVGGHLFQLDVANTQAVTFGQIARGGFPHTLNLGFNLARRF